MPFQHSIYRIGQGLVRLAADKLEKEAILEEHIAQDIGILNENWLLIGRQVYTDFGKFIDLLAVDGSGTLIIIELKKDLTPREVVAQTLDYAAWIENLEAERIAEIWRAYIKGWRKELENQSLDEAFLKKFGTKLSETDLNVAHQMVVVAARLDNSTERIISYLSDRDIPINAVLFEVFTDGQTKFLSRVWFQDPAEAPDPTINPAKDSDLWNGQFYVSFGEGDGRAWEDAMKYGFISGGGGRWYSNTLNYLKKGDQVWVNVPKKGYVGTGIVEEKAVKVDGFMVQLPDGSPASILDPRAEVACKAMNRNVEDEDLAEYLVRVKWIHTVPLSQAVKELGFFGNQNTVCRPTAPKWNHTVERLRQVWGLG
jgi:hypothetical protein